MDGAGQWRSDTERARLLLQRFLCAAIMSDTVFISTGGTVAHLMPARTAREGSNEIKSARSHFDVHEGSGVTNYSGHGSSEGGDTGSANVSRGRLRRQRGTHQQAVDKVDIPGPMLWLYHDAVSSLKILKTAQKNLQLVAPRPPWQEPHRVWKQQSQYRENGSVPGAGKSKKRAYGTGRPTPTTAITRALNGTDLTGRHIRKDLAKKERAVRVACAGEVLPWGTWPIRLRNFKGQQGLYEDEGVNDDAFYPDGSGARGLVDATRSLSRTGARVFGESGGFGGIPAGGEDSIHDELLRREMREAACPSEDFCDVERPQTKSSQDSESISKESGIVRSVFTGQSQSFQDRIMNDEGIVKRLLPNKRGQWVEARPSPTKLKKRLRHPSKPADGASTRATTDVDRGRRAALPSSSSASDADHRSPPPAAASAGKKVVLAGWYGGWVEVTNTPEQIARETVVERYRRYAAISRAGPDDPGPLSGTAAGVATKKRPRSTASYSQGHKGGDGGEEGASFGDERADQRRPTDRTTGPTRSDDRMRSRGDSGDEDLENVNIRERESDSDHLDENSDGETGGGASDVWKGWTVSQPAMDTVRRVWSRARRRARDTLIPRHRLQAPYSPTQADETQAKAGARSRGEPLCQTASTEMNCTGPYGGCDTRRGGGIVGGGMDPALLTCLGRECEGIIDAALHVVLSEQLRRSSASQPDGAISDEGFDRAGTSEEGAGRGRTNATDRVPDTDASKAADWQDILGTMWSCSERALNGGAAEDRASRDDPQTCRRPVGGVGGVKARGETKGRQGKLWGAGHISDGAVVVVSERLPGLPLNEVVLTRAYNRMLLYLHEKPSWQL